MKKVFVLLLVCFAFTATGCKTRWYIKYSNGARLAVYPPSYRGTDCASGDFRVKPRGYQRYKVMNGFTTPVNYVAINKLTEFYKEYKFCGDLTPIIIGVKVPYQPHTSPQNVIIIENNNNNNQIYNPLNN